MNSLHSISDRDAMDRAIRLAMGGRGHVEPNPMVGCVIVAHGEIIGQGYHEKFGGPHAEPNALAACSRDPAGATAFVGLEPCCHSEKKTPPCVPRLIAARLGRVVIACRDPNPPVSGRGLEQLRQAGIVAEEGLLAAEARQLNAAYFKQIEQHRPYVTLKWAQTADGKIAARRGKPVRISNNASYQIMHQLRARCGAILVGIGTALRDDPLLTARTAPLPDRPALRIVLDSHLRLPPTSQLARTALNTPTIVFCGESSYRQRSTAVAELNARNVEVMPLPADPAGGLSLEHLLDELAGRSIWHLLVEPGPTLAAAFLLQNLADRAWIFTSPRRMDDGLALAAPTMDWPAAGQLNLAGDQLSEHLNPKGAAFHCHCPSADLILSQVPT